MPETDFLINLGDLRDTVPGPEGLQHLLAPNSFWSLDVGQLHKFCNGCGASGSALPIPQTHWGLSVEMCCNIHDWMYKIGKTEADRNFADLIFLRNMIYQSRTKGSAILFIPRAYRALTYYLAVDRMGRAAFKAGHPPCPKALQAAKIQT